MGSMRGRARNHALWLGPLLALAGVVSYFTLFVRWPALRDFPWVNLPVALAGVGLSALAAWRAFFRSERYRGKILGSGGLVLSLGLGTLFCFYIFFFSYMLPEPQEATLVLAAAPDVALTDQDGGTVRLAELRGKKVVLTFYRGHW
jgi:hypothetical protein